MSFVGLPRLLLEDEQTTFCKLLIDLKEEGLGTHITPVQLNPLDCGEAQDDVELFLLDVLHLRLLDVVLSPEGHSLVQFLSRRLTLCLLTNDALRFALMLQVLLLTPKSKLA